MTEIMPFPENNIILFYWTAPSGGFFAYSPSFWAFYNPEGYP